MIFNNDLNSMRAATYESTIKNLEKAKEILDRRYSNEEISKEEYIKKAKEIENQIAKCKQQIGRDY